MPAGFRVFNADGSLQFDTGNRLFRTLTQAALGVTNGSVNFVRGPADTTVVARVQSSGLPPPIVSVGANSVSWDYGDVPNAVRGSGTITLLAY